MQRCFTIALMLGLAPLAACGKKDEKAAATGSAATGSVAATKPATPPPAAGGAGADCDPKAYKDKAGIYCVVVPEGFVLSAKDSRNEYGVQTDQFESDGHNFVIKVYKNDGSSTFDGMKSSEQKVTDDLKLVTDEAFANGNGWYTARANAKDKTAGTNSVLKTAANLIACETFESDDVKFTPADACKTLRSMK